MQNCLWRTQQKRTLHFLAHFAILRIFMSNPSASSKWILTSFEKICPSQSLDLYMSFDKFLLAVVPRDPSQADKSIIWVSSFPSCVMGSRTLNYTYLALVLEIEIDHVTQQPKETCQRTCRGSKARGRPRWKTHYSSIKMNTKMNMADF